MSNEEKRFRFGCAILAFSALGIMGASVAIALTSPDLSTRDGRHLWAGVLANAMVSILLLLIVWIPLRRKEPWACWAYLIPLLAYGLPIFVLDAIKAPRETLVTTLAPQALGLIAGLVGLLLVAQSIFKKPSSR